MNGSDKKYAINEIFYSLQGEGVRAGTPCLFLRFSGCNLLCTLAENGFDCDTEFTKNIKMTAKEILCRFHELAPQASWVICTGGEPLLQLDSALCCAIKNAGLKIAIETNGTINPPDEVLSTLDWITCSPKLTESDVKISRCDELKYVRAGGQELPRPALACKNKLISPAFRGSEVDREALGWCVDLVLRNPEWRLSVQQHKGWGIR